MRKSALQVINDLYRVVRSSLLATAVKGDVYKEGTRPLNALSEDVVINFVSGTASQIQSGIVNINVFVPDIDNGSGNMVCDVSRCRDIEGIATAWIESTLDDELYSLNLDSYRFTLDEMMRTMRYEDNKQHFVNIQLKFDYITF